MSPTKALSFDRAFLCLTWAISPAPRAAADTFIYGYGLTEVNFNLEGFGMVKGGHLNYVSVGMMASHYGHSKLGVALQSVAWNSRQMIGGEGLPNYNQQYTGSFWAGFGHEHYQQKTK